MMAKILRELSIVIGAFRWKPNSIENDFLLGEDEESFGTKLIRAN